MAIDTSLGPFNPSFEPIPNGPITDPNTGVMTGWWRNHIEGGRTRNGEIISGINRNRQNIIQLETDYTAADGALSSAYISADAVVASDAEGARAALFTTLTTAYEAADATLQADINTRATVTELTTAESTLEGSIAGQYTTITAEYTAITDTKARTFSQPTPPTATATGDLWIDTDDDNKLYRWSGSAWVAMPDARIATNAASITTEESARASGDSANATSITTLTATVNGLGIGANGCKDTEFRVITGYWNTAASGGSANALSVETSTAGLRKLRATGTGMSSTSDYIRIYADASNRLAVQEGDIVGVRAHVGAFNETKVQLLIIWRDSSGAFLSQSLYDSATGIVGGATELNTFANLSLVGTAPASATTAEIDIRAFWQTGNVGLRVVNPVIAKLASGQTAPPQYSAGAPMDAQVSQNTASITTEESARASGDSANATSITTLTAKVRGEIMPERVSVAEDFTNQTTTFAAAALSLGSIANVANYGDVREFSSATAAFISTRSALAVLGGRAYECRCLSRIAIDGTGNRMVMAFRVFNAAGTYLGAQNLVVVDGSWSVADGWQEHAITTTSEVILAAFPTAAFIKGYAAGNSNSSNSPVANWQVAFLRLSDVTISAQVTNIAEAYATDSSATARLVWTVNTSTNAATIEQTAHEGYTDGTWNGSAITLTADEITLDGDVIVTGSLTATQIAANAVTNTQVSQTAAEVSASSATWTTAASFSFTSVGIGVELRGTMSIYSQKSFHGGSLGDLEWRLLRDTTVLKSAVLKVSTVEFIPFMYKAADIVADYNDIPSSGTYTYYLQFKITSTDGDVPELTLRQASNRYLSGREFKR